ncbi:MAG: hypothetical protein EOM34_03500 [Clostridia bacterium]|nr:hypothetical protein [Lachnospiraceae bacterium]NCB99730.1 hypothetical protein [Clostridia bacterium]NCD01698.1 hypothetical protein [Clostridia bacterium]
MKINIIELEENYDKMDFCGDSLYRPALVRNIKLVPKRFVDNAEGKIGLWPIAIIVLMHGI